MRTITYESQVEQDKTVSAFLMMFLEYSQEIGLFMLLDRIVKMRLKAVVYSVLNKAQTVIAIDQQKKDWKKRAKKASLLALKRRPNHRQGNNDVEYKDRDKYGKRQGIGGKLAAGVSGRRCRAGQTGDSPGTVKPERVCGANRSRVGMQYREYLWLAQET